MHRVGVCCMSYKIAAGRVIPGAPVMCPPAWLSWGLLRLIHALRADQRSCSCSKCCVTADLLRTFGSAEICAGLCSWLCRHLCCQAASALEQHLRAARVEQVRTQQQSSVQLFKKGASMLSFSIGNFSEDCAFWDYEVLVTRPRCQQKAHPRPGRC